MCECVHITLYDKNSAVIATSKMTIEAASLFRDTLSTAIDVRRAIVERIPS